MRAVRTGTLPNGLTYFIRQNGRPANRVALRLAVKAGSLDEADDQQGLAHLIEHMAFNGSAHFKPGELVCVLRVDRRAARSARQRLHELRRDGLHARPADRPSRTSSTKGSRRSRDFAGGLTLDAEEIEKERGVVIEEWRGGLGAGIAHPRQADPGPLLQLALRRAAADRQARDHPRCAGRSACAPSTTRGIAPSGWPSIAVGDMTPRRSRRRSRRLRPAEGARARGAAAGGTRAAAHASLVSVVDRPRDHRSRRCRSLHKRPAEQQAARRPTTGAIWSQRFCST